MAAAIRGLPAHIKAEAAVWLARLHSDERTAGDEAGFRLWLGSDSRNREAFALVTGSWDEAGGAVAAAVPVRSEWTRRRMLGTGAVTALFAAGAGLWVYTVPDTYETVRGEQRRIVLSDGSILLLDTNSAVRATMASDRRVIQLDRGRAHFQVASDPLRPFIVKADGYDLKTDGALFDVDSAGDRLSAFVIKGSVGIRAEDAPGIGMQIVGAHQRVQLVAGQPARIDSPALAPLTAWHSGMVIFAASPLGRAVAEMDRYSRRSIVVADQRLTAAPVTGRFDVGDSVTFAKSVAQQLSVPLRITAEEIVVGRA